MPLMGPLLFSSTTPGNESLICSEKEDYAQIRKILNIDILDKSKKQWLGYFIDEVGKIPMNEVSVKDKKSKLFLT